MKNICKVVTLNVSPTGKPYDSVASLSIEKDEYGLWMVYEGSTVYGKWKRYVDAKNFAVRELLKYIGKADNIP